MRTTPLLAVLPACVLLTACGSGSNPDDKDAANQKDRNAAEVRFAACMRAGGIDVPDPGPEGGIRIRVPGKFGQQRIEKLQKECNDKSGLDKVAPPELSPAKAAEAQDAALKFASCMRSHGVDMPDPQVDGRGRIKIQIKAGKLSPPRVEAAQRACQKLNPLGGPPPGSEPADKVTAP